MKDYIKITLFGIVLTFLVACGGKQTMPAVDIPPSLDEKLIWSSEPKRPGWTLEEPATVNGMMHFVGLSGNYATEQQGREDAKRNSISSLVSYTGTLVKAKFERARKDFGLDSNVIDPTTSARTFEQQLSVNVAREVKAKTWYIEKWQTPTGVAHRVFLLAEVPQRAVDDSMKGTAREMARKAEQQAKEAGDAIAKKQAENATEFWKKIEEEGVSKLE